MICNYGIGLSRCRDAALPGGLSCAKHLSPQARIIQTPKVEPYSQPSSLSEVDGYRLKAEGLRLLDLKEANRQFVEMIQVPMGRMLLDRGVRLGGAEFAWIHTDHVHIYCEENGIFIPKNEKGELRVMSKLFTNTKRWVRRKSVDGNNMDRKSDLKSNHSQDNGTYVLHPDVYLEGNGELRRMYPDCYEASIRYLENSQRPKKTSRDP